MHNERQHHVFEAYLKAWSADQSFHCLYGNKVFPVQTGNIAHQRFFYEMPELTNDELGTMYQLALIVDGGESGGVNAAIVLHYFEVVNLVRQIRENTTESEELHEVANSLIRTNHELHHTAIEGVHLGFLRDILNDDLRFANDGRLIVFLHCVATQFYRTKRQKSDFEAYAASYSDDPRFKHYWQLFSTLLANIYAKQACKTACEKTLVVIDNLTDTPFITGDQPVVSLTNGAMWGAPLSFYYPLSPKRAIIWDESYRHPKNRLQLTNADQVMAYNRLVVDAAFEQLYANQAEVLRYYAPLVVKIRAHFPSGRADTA